MFDLLKKTFFLLAVVTVSVIYLEKKGYITFTPEAKAKAKEELSELSEKGKVVIKKTVKTVIEVGAEAAQDALKE